MGKPVKLSDRDKRWYRKSTSQNRPKAFRHVRQRILIVCEGIKTEPYYFESIRKQLPPNVVLLQIEGEGANTLSLVERAREIRNGPSFRDYPFDQVWVVFDRDSFPPSDFDNAIARAEADNMRCAWSNEAFELWYILHFEYRNTGMSRSEYQQKIDALPGERYVKNVPDMYDKLSARGNQKQAIAWAQKLYDDARKRHYTPSQSNPCTTVFKLVEELNKYIEKK